MAILFTTRSVQFVILSTNVLLVMRSAATFGQYVCHSMGPVWRYVSVVMTCNKLNDCVLVSQEHSVGAHLPLPFLPPLFILFPFPHLLYSQPHTSSATAK